MNGHVIDPEVTRECPSCGMHDTGVLGLSSAEQTHHICHVCTARFSRPR
jgi:transposase-like protein